MLHFKTTNTSLLLFLCALFLFSCEEDAVQIQPGEIQILNFGDSLQLSANLDVDWILSAEEAGTIDAQGLLLAGNTSGSYSLEAISKGDETNRQSLKIFVSNRAEDIRPLLKGGNIIYLRHAIARVGGDLFDFGPEGWHLSCDEDTARQLSPEGYVQAQDLGEAFKNLEIPFEDTIYVSEYCRCIQTVEELNLELPFVTKKEVTFYVYDEDTRHAQTQAFINSFSPSDKNVLIVSHSFGPGNSYPQPQQGYTVVFQQGVGTPTYKAMIRDDEFIPLK